MRSRTGCLTCRQRKLKCDEQRPICGQCIKANRQCQPSNGITFRHQHNASMNADGGGSQPERKPPLSAFYSYKNTFDENTIWVDIPRQLTFYNTSNPYLEPEPDDINGQLSLQHETPYAHQQDPWNLYQAGQLELPPRFHRHGLEALSAAALYSPPEANMVPRPVSDNAGSHDNQFGQTSPDQNTDKRTPLPEPATSPSNNLDFLLNPPPATDSPIDPNLMASVVYPPPSQPVEFAAAPKS